MIHIVTGAPCSGKSTFVEEHRKADDLVVDFDKIATALGSETEHDARGLIREAAFAARDAVIETALKAEVGDSWIIHTWPTDAQLARYTEAGAEIINLDTDRETCLARAEADGRPEATINGINKYFGKDNKKPMKYKTFNIKADEAGIIAGYFSTYDKTPDSYGDIIEPGAFTETLAKRKESGHPFPLCFNHDFSAVIGAVESIEDTEKGPYIEARFLETQLAQDVRKMLLSGAIYQFSFAYDVLDMRKPTAEEKAAGVENVLTKLEVYEISVVTVPANQNAIATEVKAGKRNSKADEDIIKENIKGLAEIAEAITERINSLESLIDEGADDKPTEETTPDEEVEPKVNETTISEEPKDNDNAKRAAALLSKINEIKGGPEL